jgi:hypothetical protein
MNNGVLKQGVVLSFVLLILFSNAGEDGVHNTTSCIN